jgi:hypothetical protein
MPTDQRVPKLLIQEWSGRASARSPHLNPAGAVVADNVSLAVPGELRCRLGMRHVTFANQTTASSAEVIGMANYRHGLGQYTIYLTTNGALKAGRDPS